VYFGGVGPENTERTLRLARERALELGIRQVLVASTSGRTGARAAEVMADLEVIVVSHSMGFATPNEQQLEPHYREAIERCGAPILTCQHALGGVGRAIRRKLGTYQIEEIVAFVLRSFCEGVKVACEMAVMAADAGLVAAGREVVAVAGTGSGADTAVVIRAANAQDFFDLRILEIICKPRLASTD